MTRTGAGSLEGFADLQPLLDPRAVAVVGASADRTKPGGRCLAGLIELGFAGEVYPVHPNHNEILGRPCYPSVAEIPDSTDLAVVLLPAAAVPAALAECAAARVRSAIVCASGLDESIPRGPEMAAACLRIARESGMLLLGPNSLGVLSLGRRLAATFSTLLDSIADLKPGPVTLVSQSGAMGAAILSEAQSAGLAIGTFVSTGNELSLGAEDVVAHLAGDETTDVILLYLESVRRGRRLIHALEAAVHQGKRIAVLQAGRTGFGQQAALLHTAALTPPGQTTAAILATAGCAVVTSPAALIGAGRALSGCARPDGPRLGIVTTSGGAGVIMADRCDDLHLEMARLSDDTGTELAALLPSFTLATNPVDCGGIAGDADRIEKVIAAVGTDRSVDLIVFFVGLSPALVDPLVAGLARFRRDLRKPLVVCWQGAPPDTLNRLWAAGLVAYSDPVAAVDAAWALTCSPPAPRRTPGGAREIREEPAVLEPSPGTRTLDEWDSRLLLSGRAVPLVDCHRVADAAGATVAAEDLGGSVAIKAAGLIHKTDLHAVALNVAPHQAAEAFRSVTAAAGGDALVQPMAPSGLELLVGTKFDASWGPLILVGRGGTGTEEAGDTAIALAPVTPSTARELILSLRCRDRINGSRGGPLLDLDSVVEVVVDISRMAAELGERLVALDINPLIVYPQGSGCLAVDAAAILRTDNDPKETPCPDV